MAVPFMCSFRLSNAIQSLERNKPIQIVFIRTIRKTVKDAPEEDEEKFRVFQFSPAKATRQHVKKVFKVKQHPPRTKIMPLNQDWSNVWPGPRTFHPAVVPLYIWQGCNKLGAPPNKTANTELMKIPNFLHLTPNAIKKHCNALKAFCTNWPESLNKKKLTELFPVEVITSDYCQSSPTIRHPEARIVTLRVKLSDLELDEHSKDKFLRLVGERYDPETDYVTITTDSCPLKKQNYDYAQYLLTALYFESWKVEAWEEEKSADDMEVYIFSERQSMKNVTKLFEYNNRPLPDLSDFNNSVENLMNKGDNAKNIEDYKQAALKLLSLS